MFLHEFFSKWPLTFLSQQYPCTNSKFSQDVAQIQGVYKNTASYNCYFYKDYLYKQTYNASMKGSNLLIRGKSTLV